MSTAETLDPGTLLDTLSGAAERVVARLHRSLVTVQTAGAGAGAGIVWAEGGLIVTNNHVAPRDRAEVVTDDGACHAGIVVARDPAWDLAALRIEAQPPAATIGDSSHLRVGQLVLAVGHPWGQRGTVTAGVIMSAGSGKGGPGVPLAESIRATVRLAPGNSGGPLADAAGQVIGVNTMIAGGVAIAIPSKVVTRFVEDEVSGGIIGIEVMPVAPAASQTGSGIAGATLLLTDVASGSPAEAAGLLPGDLLLAASTAGGDRRGPAGALRHLRAQQPVRLEILRGGVRRSVVVTPVRRPLREPA